jgi:hypothetical protein
MLQNSLSTRRLRLARLLLARYALLCTLTASVSALAQDWTSPGKSIGTVTTQGNLIILSLDENALGKVHLFDLAHRTVRFTPDGSRYRVETLPEAWDNDFGSELKDSHVKLTQFSFPFSGQTWSAFAVGITGSITFGEPPSAAEHAPGAPDREGTLPAERYALLQRVGSSFIDGTPAISAFFKPRMSGVRYAKELSDRAVVTWSLTEPYAGIQDWTWKPTVNRIQAVLYKDGRIDLSYDEVSARDAVVGIFPKVHGGEEKSVAKLNTSVEPSSAAPYLAIENIELSAVDGLFLKARLKMAAPVPAPGDANAAGLIYRLCLSASQPSRPCTEGDPDSTTWVVRGPRALRSQPGGAGAREPRYRAFGPGVSAEVSVDGSTIAFRGVPPASLLGHAPIYVSASAESTGEAAQTAHTSAQPVHLEGLNNPEMHLSSRKKQDGAFPVIYESFYYPETPRPNDLTCTVIQALGDRFDMLAYYSDFRIDNPEAGTPSTGPLGGGPNGGEVTGINAKQEDLSDYCSKGRFQWQFVQPVYMGSNQMAEYPPDDVVDTSRRDIVSYTHQLAERTFNGKLPPYDYAISQIGHEMGHRWSAFVSAKINGELIPLGPTHWAAGLQAPVAFPYQRPTEASAMGGGVWQDNFDGTWTQLDDDYYVPATGWSYLDLYLMGFIAPSEVPDFFLLRNLVPQGRDANGHRIYKADRTKVTIGDVIAAEGPRLPDVDHAQKRFNTGMVVVLEHGHAPPPELLEHVEGIRLRWMDYWDTTTGHRSAMTADPR